MKTMLTAIAFVAFTLFPSSAHTATQAQGNPGIRRPVSQREIDRLKRQISEETQSSVEAIVDYRTESGDLNHSLDFFRYGGRINLRWGPSSSVYFMATRTGYMPINATFNESGTNFTGGLHARFSDLTEGRIELGATQFSTDTTTINGLASVRFTRSEQTVFHVTASRTNVEESLLSTTGLRPLTGPFAGQLVGRVMDMRVVIGGSSRLTPRIDVSAEGGLGARKGSNVPSNLMRTVEGSVGYNVIARSEDAPLSLLRASYEISYFGFDEDRLGFGGASLLTRTGQPIAAERLGSDQISPVPAGSRAGIGGYFSPKNFVSNVIRVEARASSERNLNYRIGGFFGSQNHTGASRRSALGFSGTATIHLSERLSLPITYMIDNLGPFTQQWFSASLAVRF